MTQTIERATVLISKDAQSQAQQVVHSLSHASNLATTSEQGTKRFPPEAERAVAQVIAMMAQGKHVVVGTMPEELTTSVAAEQLGISRPTLMKLIRSGELPSHKVGSHHRVKRSDIEAFRRKRLDLQREALEALHITERELDAQEN